MDLKQKIEEIVNQNLNDEKLFLVDILVSGNKTGPGSRVLILLDGDEGVNIDSCAELSRKVASVLEAEEMFDEAYTLVVSSPGIDHPLKLHRQYTKNIGRNVRVHLNDDQTVVGQLLEVGLDKIKVGEEVKEKSKKITIKEVEIPFVEIKKTNVLVSFK